MCQNITDVNSLKYLQEKAKKSILFFSIRKQIYYCNDIVCVPFICYFSLVFFSLLAFNQSFHIIHRQCLFFMERLQKVKRYVLHKIDRQNHFYLPSIDVSINSISWHIYPIFNTLFIFVFPNCQNPFYVSNRNCKNSNKILLYMIKGIDFLI